MIRSLPQNMNQTFKYLEKIFSYYHMRFMKTPVFLNKQKNVKDLWPQLHNHNQELKKILQKSTNTKSFTQNLFKSAFFDQFETIHLFLHEKGKSHAQHLQISSNQCLQSNQKITEFTELFQAIKKSKNRSFGQASLKASNYSIIGTCLAHELSLSKHNLIFLISKNDFLPQEKEDILYFQKIIPYLQHYYDLSLSRDYNLKNIEINKKLLELISSYIDNQDSSTLPQNNFDFLINDIEKSLQKIRNNHFTLIDVNHHERISLLGELLNTLRHELSNPLFGLQLSSELLLSEQLKPDQKELMLEISKAIHRSQEIMKNFSDIYSEGQGFERFELISLIQEVFTLTKSQSKSIPKKISIKSEINNLEATQQLFIYSHQTWLAQIFFNLIINSTHALLESSTTSSQINIDIIIKKSCVHIYFSDNGPGISQSQLSDIFKPFYTTKETGTGLGLAITKSLAKKLGGKIDYVSSDNGAKFLLELPYEDTNN